MKKKIKYIYLSVVIIFLSLFAFLLDIYALSDESSYININNAQSLEVGNLFFNEISFKDYSSTSTQAFGLSGIVINDSDNEINYTIIAYYYDLNYNLIAEEHNYSTAISGYNSFNQMSNLGILNGYSINEIYYYRLSVEINDNENKLVNDTISLTPSKDYQYSYLDYVIDKYDVNIIVNENNTFDVTETITAYFNVSKHGILRTIPLKNTITRLDGTTSSNRAQVINISIDNEYTTTRDNGNYKIKIGSTDKTINGEQKYVIKYTYNIGKDPVKDYDELYYNIIGNEWDTVVGNITFSITMPKEFDSSKLGFSSGTKGLTDNSKIKYNVIGNKITGSYNGILDISEGLTVRCELPEGYFVGAKLAFDIFDLIYLIPILFLIISLLLWYKYGRDEQVVETIEFYAPKEFNSLEVGFLYKGKAVRQDVASLLIYLANQGYIKIIDNDTKSKLKDFKIIKLKEYDGNNINEQLFLNGLFSKKDEQEHANNTSEVTSKDLYGDFYMTIDKILCDINKKENKNKIFEKSASSKKIFIILMIIVTYCLITLPPIFAYGESVSLLSSLLFPGIGFTLSFKLVFGKTQTIYIKGKATNSMIISKTFGLIWGLFFGGVPWAITVLPALKQDSIYLIGYGLGLACVLGMMICLNYLPKRTQYGNEIFGKLKGFRNFLEIAEKEKLEAMVMQNPKYFYDILPYTYVLGVSDKWIKKFESISLQAPSWYDSSNEFNVKSFGSFMNSTMISTQSAMLPTNSSDSSGGSSGGGSSGGGSGGGGGGSW